MYRNKQINADNMSKQAAKCTNDFYSDKGHFTLPNGDVYEGEFMVHRSGLLWREGIGKYSTHDGQTYQGTWQDDKLVDNAPADIVYPNNQMYHGCITKNMYDSGGSMQFPCGSILLGNFSANKPDGPVTLLDPHGDVWRGVSDPKSNTIYLQPEHRFFNEIHPLRGVACEHLMHLVKLPQTSQIPEEQKEEQEEEEENVKSSHSNFVIPGGCKLRAATSAERNYSPWYDEYMQFKQQRDRILKLRENHERMNAEDLLWYRNYVRAKKTQQQKPTLKEVDALLIEKFYSEEHRMSSQGYNVIEPSYYWLSEKVAEELEPEEDLKEEAKGWEEGEEEEEEDEEEQEVEEESIVSEIEKTVAEEESKREKLKKLRSIAIGTLSMDNFLTTIAQRVVKKSKCSVEDEKKLYVLKKQICNNN